MRSENTKNTVEKFFFKITEINRQYMDSNSIDELAKSLNNLAKDYYDCVGVGDYLLNVGEEYITNGNYQSGIVFIKVVAEHFCYVANTTLLNMRMAEYHIENGETETGVDYLIKLCTAVSNYEESIEINELTEVWQKYKHLVENKVPASVAVDSCNSPSKPEDCSMHIDEIFSLPPSEILENLSIHIGELSANGDSVNSLNNIEKVVFYADELCMEVNSGGFGGYLYYNGNHFNSAYKAFETVKANGMISMMEGIKTKFPKGKIPKSLSTIQKTLDMMEEQGINFEDEDEQFYASLEKELLESLLTYVMDNKKKFR